MLSLTLDTLRRMLGAACRGVPFAESRTAAGHASRGADLIYRLKSWPQLPEDGRTADVYRVLSVMSSRPVNRQWILSRTRLDAQQVESMMAYFVAQGAVEVIDPARFAGNEACQAS